MVAVSVGVGGMYGVGVKVATSTRVGPDGAVGVEVGVTALRGSSDSAPPIEQPRLLNASATTTMTRLQGATVRTDAANGS